MVSKWLANVGDARMMKRANLLLALIWPLVGLSQFAFAETYEECILKNIKGVTNKYAVASIRAACRTKTTPKKCRQYLGGDYKGGGSLSAMIPQTYEKLKQCKAECEKAGLWSRTFGECSN